MASDEANDFDFYRIVTSPQFQFVVGPDEIKFSVSAHAISCLSEAFHAMINGRTAEAEQGSATLEDVEPATFALFCEYAYKRDYAPPSPKQRENEEEQNDVVDPTEPADKAAEDDSDEPEDDLFFHQTSRNHPRRVRRFRRESSVEVIEKQPTSQDRSEKLELLQQELWSKEYGETLTISLQKRFEPKGNSSADEDFTPVLLGHARLYVLADRYQVDGLKNLAMQKLSKTLKMMTLRKENVSGIMALASYVFGDGVTNPYGSDDLRELVVRYILLQIDVIGDTDAFTTFVAQGGPFVQAFWLLRRKYGIL